MALKLVPFESFGAVFYSFSIVTMALSCMVCEIASYWSKIVKFLYPTCIYGWPRGNFADLFDTRKTRMIALPCGEEIMTICWGVFIKYRNATDRQTELLYQYRVSAHWRAVKTI